MADRNRGEKSTVRIARSSWEQNGYERHRTLAGARLKWRDPDGIPIASWRRRENLETRKKFQEVRAKFFGKNRRWLIFPIRTTAGFCCAPQGRLKPLLFLVPGGLLGI